MRAFSPLIAQLATRELSTWNGRVVALDRMRELTLEVILRVVFGAGDGGEAARLREVIESALSTVRSLPQILAMALVMRDFGRYSPWGRFRAAVERFDETLFDLLARRRAAASEVDDSVLGVLLAQRDERTVPAADMREDALARDASLGGRADVAARIGIDRAVEIDLELGKLRDVRIGNL